MHNPAHLLSACHPTNATWTAASHTHTHMQINTCAIWSGGASFTISIDSINTHAHKHLLRCVKIMVQPSAGDWSKCQFPLVGSLISSPEPVDHTHTHKGSGWPAATLPSLPEARLSRRGPVASAATLSAVCPTCSLCLPIMHLCCSVAHWPDTRLQTLMKWDHIVIVTGVKVRIWELSEHSGCVSRVLGAIWNVTVPTQWLHFLQIQIFFSEFNKDAQGLNNKTSDWKMLYRIFLLARFVFKSSKFAKSAAGNSRFTN